AVDASGLWQDPVVTTVQPAVTFYPAEDYHQEYYLKNPGQPYCQAVVREKVDKVRALFPGLLSAG
ncbi:MAG: peptide-methionine (S)-S-oxide reductase, partial [Methylobacterium sp.]|nr:peptide-methionine (S)-S-oxide reductase [Methylobacterium sp.]